jgi:two-component system sensor histidine kinase/response regulator
MEQVAEERPDLRAKKVLVVDDNKRSGEVLQGMLTSMSFEVTLATSGAEAISDIEIADKSNTPFDIVYMDWQMPEMNGIVASRGIKALILSQQPKIIMVTTYGREELIQQAKTIHLDGLLFKPISRSLLIDATIQALGRQENQSGRTRFQIEIGLEKLRKIRWAKILLAEDNEINQQVVQEIIEQADLLVDIANNGKEAVRMVKEKEYEVILMDIQMPEMNGFEATEQIRRLEPPIKDIPIIAMTAHAMAGDREKSIAAGLNDHLTKPIDPEALFSALLKWIQPGQRVQPKNSLQTTTGGSRKTEINLPESIAGIDISDGLQRVGLNATLYKNLLVKFSNTYGDIRKQITTALEKNDKELAIRLAHTVKGVAGNIGAKDLQGAAEQIETTIQSSRDDDLGQLLDTLHDHTEAIMADLNEFVIAMEAHDKQSESGGEVIGDPQELLSLLQDLKPNIQKQKPKLAKDIMAKITTYTWEPSYQKEILNMKRLLNKFKFKDILPILDDLTSKMI